MELPLNPGSFQEQQQLCEIKNKGFAGLGQWGWLGKPNLPHQCALSSVARRRILIPSISSDYSHS